MTKKNCISNKDDRENRDFEIKIACVCVCFGCNINNFKGKATLNNGAKPRFIEGYLLSVILKVVPFPNSLCKTYTKPL